MIVTGSNVQRSASVFVSLVAIGTPLNQRIDYVNTPCLRRQHQCALSESIASGQVRFCGYE
jgi:hypothetical protein